jgi:hypothetical protein
MGHDSFLRHPRYVRRASGTSDRKEITSPMHDFLVAAAFLLMVLLPCIVTMGSDTAEGEDEA